MWRRIGLGVSAVLLVASLAAQYPSGVWLFELLQAMALPMAVAASLVGLVNLAAKCHKGSLVASVSVVILAHSVHPYLPSWPPTTEQKTGLKVGVFNVYHHNGAFDLVAEVLVGSECDVLAVIEVSSTWDKSLQAALEVSHPYQVRVPHEVCCYGMSFYSKLPIVADTVLHITRDPVIRATIDLNGRLVDIWSVHTRPPAFPNDTEERNFLLYAVADSIAASPNASILVGDLNIVPWASEFRTMMEKANLSDTRRGYLATYPMDIGLPLIPIDHVLHSEAFSAVYCRTVHIPGSDHKGLLVGLNLN